MLGGNKSLLFNAEYMVSIVSQVRLIFFYDAGQVADERESFALDKFRRPRAPRSGSSCRS